LISIARALLADPRILILDEATSNIDRPTEVLIERALDRLLAGRTSIIIAHRLSTVRRADEIVVVVRGQVAQRGTERELLATDGPFRRLAHALVPPENASHFQAIEGPASRERSAAKPPSSCRCWRRFGSARPVAATAVPARWCGRLERCAFAPARDHRDGCDAYGSRPSD